MTLHPLLLRQLKKLGLSEEEFPKNLVEWQCILQKISDNYQDTDQDRYLNERSLEISSREMHELNKRLEHSQHIAKLGYWFYNTTDQSIIWSKETYLLFGYDPLEPTPTYEEIMQRIPDDDRKKVESAMQEALLTGKSYEIEIRFLVGPEKKVRWFRCIGQPEIPEEPGKPIEKLSGVALDVTVRKESEAEISKLNEKLLDTARRAGMSEVATAILHNIGNVLNSVNVSVEIAEENLKELEFEKIEEVALMLEKNIHTIQKFITEDPQGKLIIKYLKLFSEGSQKTHKMACQELKLLTEHIRHIRDIIATQQSYARVSGLSEKVIAAESLEAALQISGVSLGARGIVIEKHYREPVTLIIDKSKLYQILVNLVQNAKDALIGSNNSLKKIILHIQKTGDNEIKISVSDNGVGIPAENLTRIFSFGFTSKKTGHGIGLHSCALAAKEMGGSLRVESDGVDRGATFILTLPIQRQASKKEE